eukprot:3933238-Rhodomonas_salina.3
MLHDIRCTPEIQHETPHCVPAIRFLVLEFGCRIEDARCKLLTSVMPRYGIHVTMPLTRISQVLVHNTGIFKPEVALIFGRTGESNGNHEALTFWPPI